MCTIRFSIGILILLLCSSLVLSGAIPSDSSGSWEPTAGMANIRERASAVKLQDGRILISGGSDGSEPTNSVEIYGSDGLFLSAAPMNSARQGHASLVLNNGAVLVTGGNESTGGATNSAEVYDPGSDSWSAAGVMSEARSGHTMTLLSDGRVLIAGGRNSGGAMSSIEIYNTKSNSFIHVGSMSSPRTDLAAALLPNGRVLLIGGSDGNQALASSDVFNPATDSVVAGPNMSLPRVGASATALLNGDVLVAGGNNGSGDLASAEIYNGSTFISAIGSLATARSRHLAFLLPKNNSVLITGGTSGDSPLASAELYLHWLSSFRPTGSMSVGRFGAFGGALANDGRLLVAGGSGLASAEVYGFATVETDRLDYAPGEIVTITGAGWQPNEQVLLNFHESPLTHTDRTRTATADSSGRIFNDSFSPEDHDIGVRFYLTAIGSSSQAQTTFTDGPLTYSPANQNLSAIAGGAEVSFSQSVTSSGNAAFTATLQVAGTGNPAFQLPASWVSTNPSSLSFPANTTTTRSWNVTINVPSGTVAGTYTADIKANPPIGGVGVGPGTHLTVVVAADTTPPDTSITAQPNDPTNSTSASFSFTGTDNVTPAASLTFECKLDAGAFTACANPKTYASLAAGLHTFQVRAKDAAGNVDASPASFTWTIDLTPPDTTITSPLPSGTSASFTFTGSDNLTPPASLTFECKLDAGAFTGCSSPKNYSGLSHGSHTFQVRAIDAAGNVDASPASATWQTDTTPPVITPNVSGTLGNNGWYTSDVSVDWTVTDPESDVTSQTGCGTTNINTDTTTAGQTITCTATSAGGTSTQSVTIKRDATPPTLTLIFTPNTPDGDNGWWKTAGGVGFTWACSDGGSGIDASFGGGCPTPPSGIVTAQGTTDFQDQVKDLAGNLSFAVNRSLKLDNVAPTINANISPARPAASGWYNISTGAPTVSFKCSDATSGLAFACPGDEHVGEGANQNFSGTIKDQAGNSAIASKTGIHVDITAPTLSLAFTPDMPDGSNGWWKTVGGVPFAWTCNDATSGIDPNFGGGCPAPLSGTVTAQGTTNLADQVQDVAGNSSAEVDRTVKLDNVAPTIIATITPANPAASGWYNNSTGAPTVSFTCSDATSGLAFACPGDEHVGEGANQNFSRTIEDQAGNSAIASKTGINVDITAPILSLAFTPDAPDGNNGWWKTVGGVGFAWLCSDATSGIDSTFNGGCPAPLSGTVTAQGTTNFVDQVHDIAGNSSFAVNRSLKLDNVAPTIIAAITPANPAASGWYNISTGAPTVSFTCSDATSGVAVGSCPADIPVGEGANQSHSGTVQDQAGNSATASKNAINVDITAPILSLAFTPDMPDGNNGWWKTVGGVGFAWVCSDATSGIDSTFNSVCPAPLSGTVTAQGTTNFADQVHDVAGNSSVAVNRSLKLDNVAPTINLLAPLALTLPQGYILNSSLQSAYNCTDVTSGLVSCSGTLPSGANFDTGAVDLDPSAAGINKSFTVNAMDQAGNATVQKNNYNVVYASGGACLGGAAHSILQPINVDGSSVFKKGSTVPAKFRVCDANGASIGTTGVVANFRVTYTAPGTIGPIDEAVDSTTPDTAFRWSPTDQQWIFNISTKALFANVTYYYAISLNDGTSIPFLHGLK